MIESFQAWKQRVMGAGTARHWSRAAMVPVLGGLALFSTGISQCNGGDDDTSPPSKLTWYYTCGDPVCSGYNPSGNVPLCTTEVAGESCTTEGATCDPKSDCNSLLVCAASDPTQEPGGCPISQKALKRDIHYLDATGLKQYRDELMQVKLATYQYKASPPNSPNRLGFMIDDKPESPAVLPNKERVDLYGYTSMTVAAVQVQAQELELLKQEIAALRAELRTAQAKNPACK